MEDKKVAMFRKRKEPITNWRTFYFFVFWIGLCLISLVYCITVVLDSNTKQDPGQALFVALISGLWIVFVAILLWRQSLTIKWRRLLERDAADTQAKIIGRNKEMHKSGTGRKDYICTLVIEYNPAEAKTSVGTLVLAAEVDEKLYEQLLQTNDIAVKYSRTDPRIVKIEGES